MRRPAGVHADGLITKPYTVPLGSSSTVGEPE